MDLGISGKTALVLGASRGLGAAIASSLAAEGAKVYAAARNADKIENLENVVPLTVDLSDKASVGVLIEKLRAAGGVDILVAQEELRGAIIVIGGPEGNHSGQNR